MKIPHFSAFLCVLTIILVGLISYSNTLEVPFLFDDGIYILNNPTIKDIQYLLHPERVDSLKLAKNIAIAVPQGLKIRRFGYLSFWANYRLGGLDVRGFHVVNIVIHITSALLVYLLVLLSFRTPALFKSAIRVHSKLIALFSGLLFVTHPIQTEAITYITQRVGSLASMFCILTIAAYTGSRLSVRSIPKYGLYLLALVSAILGMKSKEIAFTIPVATGLYEFMFFKGDIKKRMLWLVPLLLTMLIVPVSHISYKMEISGSFGSAILDSTRQETEIARSHYLFTQFRVIMTYLRLFVLPVNQNLDYDYPIYQSFLEPPVYLSFLFLLALFSSGVYLHFRSHTGDTALRLSAFGLFWFFISLSVESSVLPIIEPIFEYRMYLPSAGLIIAAAVLLVLVCERFGAVKKALVPLLVLTVVIFSVAAYARNAVWQSEITLWEDVVSKSPRKVRGYMHLGNAYLNHGMYDKAIEQFKKALELGIKKAESNNNLETAYMLNYNLGTVYMRKRMPDKAIEHFQLAAEIKPNSPAAFNSLGNSLMAKGLIKKAIESYETAISIRADNKDAYYNLGLAYASQGRIEESIEKFKTVLRLDPRHSLAHNNLGAAYYSMRRYTEAIRHFSKAVKLQPNSMEAHYNLGLAYQRTGNNIDANKHFGIAESLKYNKN